MLCPLWQLDRCHPYIQALSVLEDQRNPRRRQETGQRMARPSAMWRKEPVGIGSQPIGEAPRVCQELLDHSERFTVVDERSHRSPFSKYVLSILALPWLAE